jgi:hypothetical protein
MFSYPAQAIHVVFNTAVLQLGWLQHGTSVRAPAAAGLVPDPVTA